MQLLVSDSLIVVFVTLLEFQTISPSEIPPQDQTTAATMSFTLPEITHSTPEEVLMSVGTQMFLHGC